MRSTVGAVLLTCVTLGECESQDEHAYEVVDEVAYLSEFGRSNSLKLAYLSMAVVLAAVVGILSVLYVKFTASHDSMQQAKNFRQGMSTYMQWSAGDRNREISRLQDEYKQKLDQVEGNYKRKLQSITGEKLELEVKVRSREKELNTIRDDLDKCKKDYLNRHEEMTLTMQKQHIEVSRLSQENESMREKVNTLTCETGCKEARIKELMSRATALENEKIRLEEHIRKLEMPNKVLKYVFRVDSRDPTKSAKTYDDRGPH